jgi:hypothetical protein
MPVGESPLKRKIGPLPAWGWGVVVLIMVGAYLYYRKKKAASAQASAQANSQGVSSNLGTVPVSNLTVGAEPMPIQMGDTFVNTGNPSGTNTQTPTPTNQGPPPAGNLPPPTPGGGGPPNPVQNPYPVGTQVAPNEKIIQSIYDPLYNTWINLTSMGGLYVGPKGAAQGSAYGKVKGPVIATLGQGGKSVTIGGAQGNIGTYQRTG